MSRRIIPYVLLALLFAGCRENDSFVGAPDGARAYVTSDPPGARILVDDKETGRITPDTISGLSGRHTITARLDTSRTSYGYTAQVMMLNPDSTAEVQGPLLVRCSTEVCYRQQFRHHTVNRVRFAFNPAGMLFLTDGTGDGVTWPTGTTNSYVSGAVPLFAGLVGSDTVALGIWDTQYFAGRPAPAIDLVEGQSVTIRQTTWIVPPQNLLLIQTVRGIQVDETIVSSAAVDDVVVVRLVFRNVTADPLYRLVDPFVPAAGLTFTNAYVGFGLDPDIGTSTDDMISYEPSLTMAYAYDFRFDESSFTGGHRTSPALVGLRMLDAPLGTNVMLNGWARQTNASTDWVAGTVNEGVGWGMMSGRRVYAPSHTLPSVGHLPPQSGDMRMLVSAGPLTLAPGDTAAISVAIVIASPVEGTFTANTNLEPGDPTDENRPLFRIAAALFERALAAEALR